MWIFLQLRLFIPPLHTSNSRAYTKKKMSESSKSLFHDIFYVRGDPRVRDKLFMGSPKFIVSFVIVYLLISKYLPDYMRSRRKKYYDIRKPLVVFNGYVALASIYLSYKLGKYMIWSNYDFRCMGIDYSHSNETLEVKLKVKSFICASFKVCFSQKFPNR